MKVIKVIDQHIAVVSYSETVPLTDGWRVVPDNYPGQVGDKVSTYKGAIEAGEYVDPDVALRLADQAEDRAANAEAEMVSVGGQYDTAVEFAHRAQEAANTAVHERSALEAKYRGLEIEYRTQAVEARRLRGIADKAVRMALEAKAEEQADIARRAVIEDGMKRIREGGTTEAVETPKADKKGKGKDVPPAAAIPSLEAPVEAVEAVEA